MRIMRLNTRRKKNERMKQTRDCVFLYVWSSRKLKKMIEQHERILSKKKGRKKFILHLLLLLFFATDIYTQT
jgi:hypothetical protein